jgi:hypothetical protein
MITASPNYLVLGFVQLLVTSVGAIGNLLVVCGILLNTGLLRNIHYYLVLHLAICDFFILVFSSSDIYDSLTGSSMINSPVLCKLWWPTQTVFYNAGIFFMVIISVVRFQAVSKPLEPAMNRSKVKLLAMLAYVFATLCSLPYILVLQLDNKSGCVEEWPVEQFNICYTLFLSTIQYFIPVVLLSMIYGKICSILAKQNREMRVLCASAANQQQRKVSPFQRLRQHRNVRTFFVCLTVVVCFAVTALPRHIIWILYTSSVIEFPWYYYWFEVVQNFGVSAVNPIIYRTLDKKLFSCFIKRMRKVLHV